METEKLFREWKRRLGLLDWNLRLSVEGRDKLGTHHGCVRVFPKKKCALIRILNPTESDTTEIDPYDTEVTIVHEQLHCLLWTAGGEDGSVEDLIQEQAIHSLSAVLVAQQRQIRKLESKINRKIAPKRLDAESPEAA